MPVFDTAAAVRQSIGRNTYLENKALRSNIDIKEKQATALQQKIDANIPERAMTAEEGRLEVQQAQEARLGEAWNASKDEKNKEEFVRILDASEAAYQNSIASGLDEPSSRAASYEIMLDEADRLNGDSTREDAAAKLAEQGFTPDTWDPIRVRSVLGIRPLPPKEPTTLADGAMLVDEKGNVIVENTKDFAPDRSGGDKPTYDPPNTAEIEAAAELIKNDPLLDDLETSAESKVAAMTLANDIRQLQEDLGIDYATAAGIALKQLKRRVTTESDFLSGKDSKLNLGAPELASDEYLGKDGNVYVEEPDGSFRRK